MPDDPEAPVRRASPTSAAPPFDYGAMSRRTTPVAGRRPASRAASGVYNVRADARDAASLRSPRTERRRGEHVEDEAASVTSGSSLTSVARPYSAHAEPGRIDLLSPEPAHPEQTYPTPAERVRMEAQAGVARVPNTPGHTSDEEAGQRRARTQHWVQAMHVPVLEALDDAGPVLPEATRRYTNSSQLSDWTMDVARPRASNRSSVSTVVPRSPSPYAAPGDTSAASANSTRSPRSQRTARGTPLLARDAQLAPPMALPSISAQMGHRGYMVPTTELLNTGLGANAAPVDGGVRPDAETRLAARRIAAATRRRTPSDFVFGEVLGEGSYSTVLKAWDVHELSESERAALAHHPSALDAAAGQEALPPLPSSAKAYAVKILDKVHILKEKKQKYVRVEKEALSLLLHRPGVVALYHTFQDRESLYFVLELAPNGEFLHHVQQLGTLDTRSACFYAAELADAIHGIHQAGVVHRDIKPENLLLDAHMHILVTDFGSAKIVGHDTDAASATNVSLSGRSMNSVSSRTGSFVGTAEYVSPELLGEKSAGMPSDWWAFGCVVFQMLAGHSPFKAANEYQTFQRILHRLFTFPPAFPELAQELIERVLVLDPDARPDADTIKRAPFFHDTDFRTIWSAAPPPMQPGVVQRHAGSTRTYSQGLRELETSFDSGNLLSSSSSNPTRSATCDEASMSSSDETQSVSPMEQRMQRPDGAHTAPRAAPRPSTQSTQRSAFVAELYDDLMLPNEIISYSSPIVLRRCGAGGMFSKRCQLLLTSYPRLLCVRETTRMLKVLCEVVLRPVPKDALNDGPQAPDTHLVLDRSSFHASTPRRTRSHSLRSQPSLPALPFQSMNALSRSFSRMGSHRTASDALTRFASTGDRSDARRSDAPLRPGSRPSRETDGLRSPIETNHVYGNWLLHVEVRPPKMFVVHTPNRAYLLDDPAGDPQYWCQCINEAKQQYAMARA